MTFSLFASLVVAPCWCRKRRRTGHRLQPPSARQTSLSLRAVAVARGSFGRQCALLRGRGGRPSGHRRKDWIQVAGFPRISLPLARSYALRRLQLHSWLMTMADCSLWLLPTGRCSTRWCLASSTGSSNPSSAVSWSLSAATPPTFDSGGRGKPANGSGAPLPA